MTKSSQLDANWAIIGKVGTAHGVRGEVSILPETDDPNRFTLLKQITLRRGKEMETFSVASVRFHKGRPLLRFKELSDRTAVELWRHAEVLIPREERMPLPEGRYYIDELEGLEVYTEEAYLGILKEVLQPGANDVYVVERPEQSDLLLPAIKEVIKEVDLQKGRMQVHLLEGLDV